MKTKEEVKVDILNSFIEHWIDMFGYKQTIEFLLDQGATEDLLINDLLFDVEDVRTIMIENNTASTTEATQVV